MLRQTAANESGSFQPWQQGLWTFRLPREGTVIAGVAERSCDLDGLRDRLTNARHLIQAEQVHGASVASVETAEPMLNPIPGCDALATTIPGVALVIRTADCLPLVVWDPIRRAVALAHVGWRGLMKHLPIRLLGAMGDRYHSHPDDLWVGIGPAIRACCYEVGKEFEPWFGPFLRQADGRRTCDLIGCATQQLMTAGLRASHVLDCAQCTACDAARWHSVRRDKEASGRLLSFAMVRP